MPIARNPSLHGAAPDRSPTALLILDMISDFDFEAGERVCAAALPVARRIARLKLRAGPARVPVIYVNDNRGRWRSDFTALVRQGVREGSRGAPIVRMLMPGPLDYCVLKPKHSGFFGTILGTLLEYLGTRRLVLTGVSAQQCVLFTANDAYVRDLELLIPRDCVASESPAMTRLALRYFKQVLGANLAASTRIRLDAVRAGSAIRRSGPARASARSAP
jgi:nicotinamidase-related amidase